MKDLSNQRGLTLVEVLATLVIVSIVGILVWNLLFQGFDFSKRTISANELQKEANLINTNIQNLHTKHKIHNIYVENNALIIEYDEEQKEIFNHPNIYYNLIDYSILETGKRFQLEIELKSTTNENIKYQLKTHFNKLL